MNLEADINIPDAWQTITNCYHCAIIVPFRNQEEHQIVFLRHMHQFLQRQQIEYRIFFIEQPGRHNE